MHLSGNRLCSAATASFCTIEEKMGINLEEVVHE